MAVCGYLWLPVAVTDSCQVIGAVLRCRVRTAELPTDDAAEEDAMAHQLANMEVQDEEDSKRRAAEAKLDGDAAEDDNSVCAR